MAFLCGSAPKAPDPYVTAQAQAQANQQSITDAAKVNQINQVTPYGAQTFTGTIGQPDRTVTTTLSPTEQAKQDTLDKASLGLGSHVNNRLGQITDTPFSLSGLPAVNAAQGTTLKSSYDPGGPIQNSIADSGAINGTVANAGQIQRGVAPGGPIQGSVGGADAATRNSVEDALYQRATSRLDPQFQASDRALETRLANQGITQGSDAYTRAKADAARNENDAYSSARNDAITGGGAEQSRLFGMGVDAGNFANSAEAQKFGEGVTSGNFTNSAQAQQYGQNANDTTVGNTAQAQRFGQNAAGAQFANDAQNQANAQNAAAAGFANTTAQNQFNQNEALQTSDTNNRNQGISEYLMGRSQPINEVNALTSGTQVQAPSFAAPSQYSPQGVPVGDYIQQNYQQQSANRNALIGALGSVAGAAGGAAIMKCWVAREVYGITNPRWLKVRAWMTNKAPKALHDFYMTHGPAIADFIRTEPEWKARIHTAMEEVLV